MLLTTYLSKSLPMADVPPELQNLNPDYGFLGTKFTSLWQALISGLLGLGIVLAIIIGIYFLITMLISRAEHNPQKAQTAKKGMLYCLGVLGGCVLFGSVLAFAFGLFDSAGGTPAAAAPYSATSTVNSL